MVLQYKSSGLAFLIILCAGALATIGMFSVPEVSAEKCNNNEDNNCNGEKIYQKSWTANRCDLGNENDDQSKKNTDDNLFACVNTATNLQNLAVIPDQFAEIR